MRRASASLWVPLNNTTDPACSVGASSDSSYSRVRRDSVTMMAVSAAPSYSKRSNATFSACSSAMPLEFSVIETARLRKASE